MGPETTMFSQTSSTNSDSTLLAVPKLRDDGSNWSDYHPRIQNAMGAKGLWRHVLGTATAPVPYVVTEGIPMLSDGKTPATEDQIEAKESKIIEFEKREYLARHILLSTTSTRLGAKIKDLSTAEAMWKVVTDDATSKSTLYLLDAEDQLTSMKLADDEDPKTHLSELKQHFQLMLQRRDNLITIGSTISESRFNIIIMSSLPASYRPTLQTITATERINRLSGSQANAMKSDDLIAFIIEEAQHRVINDERSKSAELALAARIKRAGKSERKDEYEQGITCENCQKTGHTKDQCYSKGGGKEGQGPRQRKKAREPETAVVAMNDEEGDLFAFTCTLDHVAIAEELEMTESRLGMACIDSRTSKDYRLDRTKSTNHKSIQSQRTPARALNNKHPYKMCNTRKPHLTGIQEFGTAAHFKDLTLGKLDARVTRGRFMGYESKSAIVLGEAQSEGEKDEIIQASQKNVDVDEPAAEPEKDQPQQHLASGSGSETHQSQEPTDDDNVLPDLETPDDDPSFNPEYGRRKGTRHPKRGRPRGITPIKFTNLETAVTTVDSAFRKPTNLEKHGLPVKSATGIRDQRPITVQPGEKPYFSGAAGDGSVIFQQFGDSTINIHSLKKTQTDELTLTGFITFKNMRTAGEALVALNSTQTPGGDTLDLSYAHRRSGRRRRKKQENKPTSTPSEQSRGASDMSEREGRLIVPRINSEDDARHSRSNPER